LVSKFKLENIINECLIIYNFIIYLSLFAMNSMKKELLLYHY